MTEISTKPDGIVYVLSNRGFWLPERETDEELLPMVKIGYTKPATPERLRERMSELFSTGVPVPFDLEYARSVADSRKVERRLHTAFAKSRVNQSREFFHVAVDSIVAVLEMIPGMEVKLKNEISKDITRSDIIARNRLQSVASRTIFSFGLLQIPKGAKLVYVTDPNETAEVVSDTEVKYRGKIMGASAAATKIHRAKYGDHAHGRSAFYYWKYNGQTMQQIRAQVASEKVR